MRFYIGVAMLCLFVGGMLLGFFLTEGWKTTLISVAVLVIIAMWILAALYLMAYR